MNGHAGHTIAPDQREVTDPWALVPKSPLSVEIEAHLVRREVPGIPWIRGISGLIRNPLGFIHMREVAGSTPASPIVCIRRRDSRRKFLGLRGFENHSGNGDSLGAEGVFAAVRPRGARFMRRG